MFNIASGTQVTINQLIKTISEVSGIQPILEYKDPRPGDVRDSLADINSAKQAFNYNPQVELKEGLKEYYQWAKKELIETIA